MTDTGCRKYPKNINIYVHIVISYLYLTLTNTQITLLQLPFCWRLEHPHIVKMYECFEERQSLWLVSGTLRDGSGSSRAESGEYLWSWCMIVETFAFWVNCSTVLKWQKRWNGEWASCKNMQKRLQFGLMMWCCSCFQRETWIFRILLVIRSNNTFKTTCEV